MSTVRGMNNDLVDEFIEHIIGQLRDVLILLHKSHKTVDIGPLRSNVRLLRFKFRNTAFEPGLFFIILRNELLDLTFRQRAVDLALIESPNQIIEFGNTSGGGGKLLLFLRCGLFLPLLPLCHKLADESILVLKDILRYGLNGFQKSSFKLLYPDVVRRAGLIDVAVFAALEAA